MQFVVLCIVFLICKSVFGEQCGKVASRNIIHQTPWLVYLEYYRRGLQEEVRCAGTLISSRHVVTAAHCVMKSRSIKMVVRLGEYDTTSTVDCVEDVCGDEVVRVPVEEATVHPEYDETEHDIAILKLERDVPYNDFIRPICLPTGNINKDTKFIASGWGEMSQGTYSPTTKHIILPILPLNQCYNAYPTVKLPYHFICAGGEEGVDTCRGDSGGPLALIRDKVQLWGVTSSGNTRCGKKGKPGIYTSVFDHLLWIQEVLSQK